MSDGSGVAWRFPRTRRRPDLISSALTALNLLGKSESHIRDTRSVGRDDRCELVQNPLPCMPCQLEGCERRLDSFSVCLDDMPLSRVMSAIDAARHAGTVRNPSGMAAGVAPAAPGPS